MRQGYRDEIGVMNLFATDLFAFDQHPALPDGATIFRKQAGSVQYRLGEHDRCLRGQPQTVRWGSGQCSHEFPSDLRCDAETFPLGFQGGKPGCGRMVPRTTAAKGEYPDIGIDLKVSGHHRRAENGPL